MYDPFSVEGKVTVITGGGTGIGASIAREFAIRGAPVLICGRRTAPLEETRDAIRQGGGRCEMTTCDVRESANLDALIATAVTHFERVDVMVNNAGAAVIKRIVELSDEEWHNTVASFYDSVFYGSRAAARQMIAQGKGGSIINISSNSAFMGWPGLAPYTSTKAAVNNFTMTAAAEWAPHNIRINAICPGPILVEKNTGRTDYLEKQAVSRPMQRMGRVEEIAYPAIFLASDASSYMTGTTLLIEGGPGWRIDLI
jgi:NAD(P)-dependent dehydrogenase (short-subunit alcohol dehydrogenase family)